MQINKNNSDGITERSSTVPQGKVVIAANLIRESEMIDRNGNVINPRTKQIISKAENE